jgi:predicted nuclease of restriction endonuclease-like RecB superfamily
LASDAFIRYSVRDGVLVPRYLSERDHVWLRALIDEYERAIGRPRRELVERLRDPLPCASPAGMTRQAADVLDRLHSSRCESAVPPVRARAAVFGEAARTDDDPDAVLVAVGATLGVAPGVLRDALFADLPGEQRITSPARPVSAGELALRVNLGVAQSLLRRSTSVAIEVEGNARTLVRHAKLQGLICVVAPRRSAGDAVLEISGPLSLFRHTLLYGRALAGLVPLLGWCNRFRLTSACTLQERALRFELSSGDPVFPSSEPKLYDSRLEERFARDFRRSAPDFDLVREPEAVEAAGHLIFPDFALQRRSDPSQRWLLEIVGFWTPEYLSRKLAQIRAARVPNLILCLDDSRNCGERDLPADVPVVRFRRRIDPAAVLRALGR